MGLDISFNKTKALAAGMELLILPNGTAEQIQEAQESGNDDGYTKWLQETELCMKVPTTEYFVAIGNDPETCWVRANKWGSTYEPLTARLKAHSIDWRES